MPEHITTPVTMEAAGNVSKEIREYIGRASNGETDVSIARMSSPSGWTEPGQRPEFDEYTLVLSGSLKVESEEGTLDVTAGQAVIARAGQWVRYASPSPEGAEYVAICLPAFSPETVGRDA